MKLQTVEIEREISVEELLQSKGLNPNLYFVSVDGVAAKNGDTIKAGQKTQIIPAVKGG